MKNQSSLDEMQPLSLFIVYELKLFYFTTCTKNMYLDC